MPTTNINCKAVGLTMIALAFPMQTYADNPSILQDLQIAGRVLSFQEGQTSRELTLGIVYNRDLVQSRAEADTLMAALGRGLSVGSLILLPHLIEQSQLAEAKDLAAIFSTLGVDDRLLSASIKQHRILCLTRHLEQTAQGSCTVAISSSPSVTIIVNQSNAAAAGLRFATAFRMMVREI